MGFETIKIFAQHPFFPLVGSVGKNGFWYNTKSDEKYKSRQSIFGETVVKGNKVVLSEKSVKLTLDVTRALKECCEYRLANVIQQERSIEIKEHNNLKE